MMNIVASDDISDHHADDDDLIIIKKYCRKGTTYTARLTALLEHGKFRAEHYPQYLVFFGGFSLTLMLPE